MKPVLTISLVLFAIVLAMTTESSDAQRVIGAGGNCYCTLNYNPICASDRRTYGNTCQLECERRRRPGN